MPKALEALERLEKNLQEQEKEILALHEKHLQELSKSSLLLWKRRLGVIEKNILQSAHDMTKKIMIYGAIGIVIGMTIGGIGTYVYVKKENYLLGKDAGWKYFKDEQDGFEWFQRPLRKGD